VNADVKRALVAAFRAATDEQLGAATHVGRSASDIDDVLARAAVAEVSPLLCIIYWHLHRLVGDDLEALTDVGWDPSPAEFRSMIMMLLGGEQEGSQQ